MFHAPCRKKDRSRKIDELHPANGVTETRRGGEPAVIRPWSEDRGDTLFVWLTYRKKDQKRAFGAVSLAS